MSQTWEMAVTTAVLPELPVKCVSYPSFRKMLDQASLGILKARWRHHGLTYNPA